MPEPLARLDEIAEAATPGPWYRGNAEVYTPAVGRACGGDYRVVLPGSTAAKDLDYIATFSPELVKRLLAVVGIVNDHRSYCGAIDRLNTALSDLFAYLEDENEKEAWAAGEGPGLNPAEKP